MDRKNFIITALAFTLIVFFSFSIVNLIPSPPQQPPIPRNHKFIISTSSGPYTLDHVDSWDSASNDVLEQVVETLFSYNFSDLNLPRTNHLAYTYWWKDNVTLQIRLREGILFHDGTPFNAQAAKWNLDRLLYLTNCSGTNKGEVAHTQSLWMLPDGRTPIIKEVASMGDYNITITLNSPYGPLLNTLAYINAGMISPNAHVAEAERFIDLTTGKPIGTGPFKYIRFVPNVECRLERWEQYWMAPANFPVVIFAIYSDVTPAHNDYLAYQIDFYNIFSDQHIAFYEADPKLRVHRFTEETGSPNLVYQYLGFNNEKYNRTWRKAMSYAINYSYIIENLRFGLAVRAVSPISPGYGSFFNSSVKGVNYNLTKARETMGSMGFGNMSWTDAQWIAVADSGTPFRTVLYNYNIGNTFRENLGVALTDWFKLIGIELIWDSCTFWDPWGWDHCCFWGNYDQCGIFAIGWGPDYLDPYNMLEPLFNNISRSNAAQVNDPKLQAMLALVLETNDDAERTRIYKDIQYYISEVGFFHAPLYHSNVVYNHMANIYGVPYNSMGALRIYPMYRGLFPI
jgi:peptide/nickel transport system substrate-binding protein